MSYAWVKSVTDYLIDAHVCPRCDAVLAGPVCGNCGADLGGDAGKAVASASRKAAEALLHRQSLIDSLETESPAAARAPAAPRATAAPVLSRPGDASGRPASQISVQS